MIIEARKLIGLPVAAIDTESKIGTIREIIIDPETGKLLGFLVKTGVVFSRTLALSIVDVKEWDPNGIVTESIENLVPADEIIRIKNVLEKYESILNMKAKTESGKSLGLCENFLIDTVTESVIKFYLKDILGKTRIFPTEALIKIDKALIFRDDVAEIPPGNAVVTA